MFREDGFRRLDHTRGELMGEEYELPGGGSIESNTDFLLYRGILKIRKLEGAQANRGVIVKIIGSLQTFEVHIDCLVQKCVDCPVVLINQLGILFEKFLCGFLVLGQYGVLPRSIRCPRDLGFQVINLLGFPVNVELPSKRVRRFGDRVILLLRKPSALVVNRGVSRIQGRSIHRVQGSHSRFEEIGQNVRGFLQTRLENPFTLSNG